MPTYVYRREDGSTFEIEQKITDDKLETCPETGQPVTRLISGGSFHLKGSGFYETDYVRNGEGNAPGSGNEKGSAEPSDTTSESNGSSESETDPATSTSKTDADP